MGDKKKKFQFVLWVGAVLGSIIAFLIVKLFWKEANPVLLLVFLIIGYLIYLMITIRNQSNKEKGS
jgi:F0F1-type ATP synthase assembly protein I